MKKWVYALVGLIAMLLAGLIYAWGVLSAPIAAEFADWGSTGFSFTFTLCMIFFCLGSILAAAHGGYHAAALVLVIMGAASLPAALGIRVPKKRPEPNQ